MKNKASLSRNPVAKHLNTFNKPSVEVDKKRLKQSDAILRDADQIVSEGLFYSGTMCFDEDGNDGCTGCLGDIGCSSVSVNTFEDNYEGEK